MIPDEIAYMARYPSAASPEPFPESGSVRVVRPTFVLMMTPMPTVTFVEAVTAEPSEVGEVVEEVRSLMREHGRRQSAWNVPAGSPLAEALTSLGLTPYTDPPLGPSSMAMALVTPPLGTAGAGIEVREATTLEDFVASAELAADLFEMTGDDRLGMVDGLRRRYDLWLQGRTRMRTYLAYVDGELVGEAQSTETDFGTNLSGSSVLPSARGRGVYRAFVAARWESAVARGLPALTVQAGDMSAPILERLGFSLVEEMALLCDRGAGPP